jgi:hypothetical protein
MDATERRRNQRKETATKTRAMTVPCPTCSAPVGEPCDREHSRARVICARRVLLAYRAGEFAK